MTTLNKKQSKFHFEPQQQQSSPDRTMRSGPPPPRARPSKSESGLVKKQSKLNQPPFWKSFLKKQIESFENRTFSSKLFLFCLALFNCNWYCHSADLMNGRHKVPPSTEGQTGPEPRRGQVCAVRPSDLTRWWPFGPSVQGFWFSSGPRQFIMGSPL